MSRRRAAFATHSAPPAWRCTSGLLLRGGASWPIWHAVLHPPQVLPPCGLRGPALSLPSATSGVASGRARALRAPARTPAYCAILFAVARPRPPQRAQPPLPASLTSPSPSVVRAASRQPARQPCRRLPARLLACPPAAARDGRTFCVSSGHPNGGGAALFGRRPSCPGVPVSRGREWPHTGCAPRHRWPWVAVGGPHARPPIARRPQRLRLWDAHTHAHAR